MNCKQGDLARIVAPDDPAHGYIVRCLYLVHHALNADGEVVQGDLWRVDPDVPMTNGKPGNCVRDANLRPIRDPGDDAVDESRAWLPPVPTPTKEPA